MILEIFYAYSDIMRNIKNHLEMRDGRIIMSLKGKFKSERLIGLGIIDSINYGYI